MKPKSPTSPRSILFLHLLALVMAFAVCPLHADETKPNPEAAKETPAQAEKIYYPAATRELTPGKTTPATPAVPPAGHSPIATSFLYIAFLGALAYATYIIWKKKIAPQKTVTVKASTIEITTTRPLGNRQFLVVAQYKDKEILLGVGQGFITRLDTAPNLNDKESSPCAK